MKTASEKRARHLKEIDELRAATEKAWDIVIGKVPEDILQDCFAVNCGGNGQFSLCTREQAIAVIRSLGAGKWKKEINAHNPTKIDYEATIDGVDFIIHQCDPPDSCRIEETREVKEVVTRKLVCA